MPFNVGSISRSPCLVEGGKVSTFVGCIWAWLVNVVLDIFMAILIIVWFVEISYAG